MIRGITVTLLERIQTETDPFGRPVYAEVETQVENVIVYPAASEDVISEQNLTGKHLEFYLCVPKDDSHEWEGCRVQFFGKTWTVFGFPEEWIDTNNPTMWNRRYKCERYSK